MLCVLVVFVINGSIYILFEVCLVVVSSGVLCVQVNWLCEGLVVCSDVLLLVLVQLWLLLQFGCCIYLCGDVSLDVYICLCGNVWEGYVEVCLKEGGVCLGENCNIVGDIIRGELVCYDQFLLKFDMILVSIKGYLGMGFQGNGFVDVKMQIGWEVSVLLNGEFYFNMLWLYWLELFLLDIV